MPLHRGISVPSWVGHIGAAKERAIKMVPRSGSFASFALSTYKRGNALLDVLLLVLYPSCVVDSSKRLWRGVVVLPYLDAVVVEIVAASLVRAALASVGRVLFCCLWFPVAD